MSPILAYMLAVALGLILGAGLLEWSDLRERRRREWEESRGLDRARNVTGRVVK